jgi:hypothetical protein
MWLTKIKNFLRLRNSCGIDGISNDASGNFKKIALPKGGKDPKFPQNLRLISLLSTTGKFLKKLS